MACCITGYVAAGSQPGCLCTSPESPGGELFSLGLFSASPAAVVLCPFAQSPNIPILPRWARARGHEGGASPALAKSSDGERAVQDCPVTVGSKRTVVCVRASNPAGVMEKSF